MGKYGEIQEDFYTERTRILGALAEPENQHMIMRLIGALAFRTHCPQFGHIQDELGRKFTDIDFASYPRFFKDISRLLAELGYDEDRTVTQLFSESRLLFHDPLYGRHIDIFFNKLDFCHPINFVGRLEKEELTLPLAELLLEKMQIVKINEKDLIDTIMLLREHPIGDSDEETINGELIAQTLANDWGFWRTVTGNLQLVKDELQHYTRLSEEDRAVVRERIEELMQRIESKPKTQKWRLRAAVGERIKWYKDVEELMHR
ncbi:MAG: hypothetical protein ACOY16_00245 [Chloroflexota bacterium]